MMSGTCRKPPFLYRATEVRIRAERRVGQLLQAMQRTPPQVANPFGINGGHIQPLDVTPPKSEYATGIERAGLTASLLGSFAHLAV
jgi:hypothetical protein